MTAPLVLKAVEACDFHGPARTAPVNRVDLAFLHGGASGLARDNLSAKIKGSRGVVAACDDRRAQRSMPSFVRRKA